MYQKYTLTNPKNPSERVTGHGSSADEARLDAERIWDEDFTSWYIVSDYEIAADREGGHYD